MLSSSLWRFPEHANLQIIFLPHLPNPDGSDSNWYCSKVWTISSFLLVLLKYLKITGWYIFPWPSAPRKGYYISSAERLLLWSNHEQYTLQSTLLEFLAPAFTPSRPSPRSYFRCLVGVLKIFTKMVEYIPFWISFPPDFISGDRYRWLCRGR
jgi:hypothetical protein